MTARGRKPHNNCLTLLKPLTRAEQTLALFSMKRAKVAPATVIYIEKNLIKYGHPNYIETFISIRMVLIFTDFFPIDTPYKKCIVMWTIMELIGRNQ